MRTAPASVRLSATDYLSEVGMRHRVRMGLLALAVAAPGCAADHGIAPGIARGTPEAATASVPGAWAYKATAHWVDGWFADVNDRNLIVGMANGRAVALPWGGALYTMSSGPGISAQAKAVNTHGVIVGSVTPNCCQWADLFPAVWKDYLSVPKMLPDTGEATDINDQGQVVGYVIRRGVSQAFVWDLKLGSVVQLSTLARGGSSSARAINNDQVILGVSDNRQGQPVTVLWRRNGSGWTVQAVNGGIDGMDLDSGVGIVGHNAYTASFGSPNYAGNFNVLGFSWAEGVSRNGVLAVGTDAGAATGWPVSSLAFIADRGGTTTYLPWPSVGTWRDGFASGVTDCGLVVGSSWPLSSNFQPFSSQPVVWDPGC